MKELIRNLGILRPFFRGLPIIALVMIIAVLIAKRYLRYTTPIYESTAKVKLADSKEGVPNSNLFKDFDVFATSNKIAAEVELLKSKLLIQKAVANLGVDITIYRVGDIHKTELYHQSPFFIRYAFDSKKLFDKTFTLFVSSDSLLSITLPDGKTVKGRMNVPVQLEGGSLVFIPNEELRQQKKNLQVNDHYEFICHSQTMLADKIIADLDVMSVDKEVPVLRISYKSPVAEKAAEVVNALSAAYITDYVSEKFKSADTTVDFLAKQLNSMSDRLSASEANIESYRNQNNIINIRQETETDLRKISDLKKQQASLQMNLLAMRDLNKYISSGKQNFEELAPNFEAFTDLLSTELVKKMKELQREKRDLLLKYTPDNDKVKVVDDKMQDISKYLQESIKNTEKNLQVKYDDLSQTISKAEEAFIGLPGKERTMTILERNFSLNEQIYRFLHEKRTEAEIARAATMSFHRIIAEGEVPTKPVSPNATLLKVLAGFLGFLFGVAGVYFIHLLKGRINESKAIHKNSETPLMAEVPYAKNEADKMRYFMRWATELDLKGIADAGSVISISSFAAKEGKGFNSTGVTMALQQLGKKCVLIDAGASNVRIPGVSVIGPSQFPPQWQVRSVWMAFLETLKQQYEVVIIRNLPVLEQPVSMMLMATANTNLFVLDSRKTKQSMVMQADLLKEELSLPGMYFVLNRAGYTPSIFAPIANWWRSKKNRSNKQSALA
jgi:uncharacterized protein involved in exopolysaccharide biosynthesis